MQKGVRARTQPPKLAPTQAGHDSRQRIPTALSALHNLTPQNTYYTVLVTTPTAWHSSTHSRLFTSANQQ